MSNDCFIFYLPPLVLSLEPSLDRGVLERDRERDLRLLSLSLDLDL